MSTIFPKHKPVNQKDAAPDCGCNQSILAGRNLLRLLQTIWPLTRAAKS
jgi:hypothetical protein